MKSLKERLAYREKTRKEAEEEQEKKDEARAEAEKVRIAALKKEQESKA